MVLASPLAPLPEMSLPSVQSYSTEDPNGIPTDLPADLGNIASLYGAVESPSTSKTAPDGENAPPRIGTLTSLIDPPPGYVYNPPLTEEQVAVGKRLSQLRQGIATVDYRRAVGVFDGLNMNCGIGYLSNYFKTHFVAIPKTLFRRGELCGVCLRLWCVDDICTNTLNATNYGVFMITDSCEECQTNDIVIAADGIKSISGVDYDNNPSLQVSWEFVPCSPLIFGGIRLVPSENNNENFLGLNFSNLKVPIKAVSINGMAMARTTYVGFYSIDSPETPIQIRPPYTIQLLSVNDQTLQVTIPTLRAQDLEVNFDA